MNSVICMIESVAESGSIRMVRLKSGGMKFDCITLELPPEYRSGKSVLALFKETETALGFSSDAENSMENRLECRVTGILRGNLVSQVLLESPCGQLSSVVTNSSLERLRLKSDDSVVAQFAASSVSLAEPANA